MPRKQTFVVKDYPHYVPESEYDMIVTAVDAQARAKTFEVRLEHLDGEQAGRIQVVTMPLPVGPEGLAASFFRACGLSVSVGARITPSDAVGQVIKRSFRSRVADARSIEFKRGLEPGQRPAGNAEKTNDA